MIRALEKMEIGFSDDQLMHLMDKYPKTVAAMELKIEKFEKVRISLVEQNNWLSDENKKLIKSNVLLTQKEVKLTEESAKLLKEKELLLQIQDELFNLQKEYAELRAEKEAISEKCEQLEKRLEIANTAQTQVEELWLMSEKKTLLNEEITKLAEVRTRLAGENNYGDLKKWIKIAVNLAVVVDGPAIGRKKRVAKIIAKMPDVAMYGDIPDLYEYSDTNGD